MHFCMHHILKGQIYWCYMCIHTLQEGKRLLIKTQSGAINCRTWWYNLQFKNIDIYMISLLTYKLYEVIIRLPLRTLAIPLPSAHELKLGDLADAN